MTLTARKCTIEPPRRSPKLWLAKQNRLAFSGGWPGSPRFRLNLKAPPALRDFGGLWPPCTTLTAPSWDEIPPWLSLTSGVGVCAGRGRGMRLYFRGRRVRSVSRYTGRKVSSRRRLTPPPTLFSRLKQADRSSLLVTTALASTLVIGALFAPTPAAAVNCPQPPGWTDRHKHQLWRRSPASTSSTSPTTPATPSISHTDGTRNFITLYNSGILNAADDGIDASNHRQQQLHHHRECRDH